MRTRAAFTLVELLISIVILSVLMLFLYKSYVELNSFNRVYKTEVEKLQRFERIKKRLFLDLSLAKKRSLILINSDKAFDMLSFMSSHSVHQRINPYITYIVKDKVLYRLESRRQIKSSPVKSDISFDIDKLGAVEKFKIFSIRGNIEYYLCQVKFRDKAEILFKVKVLN
jgi:prepilin-type N-terminal cleavage/methylation domain-containing protein